jgi:phosphatidylglycerol:prolipoprotein diacylglycerol transferase
MLTISADPVAFTIGSHDITWYGITAAVGVASLLVLMLREAKRLGIARDIYGIFFWGVIGGLVGGRLAYVIFYWEDFATNPIRIIGFSGLIQSGMVIGIVAAALIYMGVTRMRFSTLLSIGDAFAVGAPLALGIGRIGCTLNGCCYGQPSPFDFFPLAVVYTPRYTIPHEYWGVALYPTQIYHLLWNLIIFAIVLRFRRKFKPEGSLVFFYFCLHAIGDIGIRFLRAGQPFLGSLDLAQFIDLLALVVFLPWLIIKMRQFQKQSLAGELANEAEPGQNRVD